MTQTTLPSDYGYETNAYYRGERIPVRVITQAAHVAQSALENASMKMSTKVKN